MICPSQWLPHSGLGILEYSGLGGTPKDGMRLENLPRALWPRVLLCHSGNEVTKDTWGGGLALATLGSGHLPWLQQNSTAQISPSSGLEITKSFFVPFFIPFFNYHFLFPFYFPILFTSLFPTLFPFFIPYFIAFFIPYFIPVFIPIFIPFFYSLFIFLFHSLFYSLFYSFPLLFSSTPDI